MFLFDLLLFLGLWLGVSGLVYLAFTVFNDYRYWDLPENAWVRRLVLVFYTPALLTAGLILDNGAAFRSTVRWLWASLKEPLKVPELDLEV